MVANRERGFVSLSGKKLKRHCLLIEWVGWRQKSREEVIKANMILEVIRYGEHVLRSEEKGTPSFELGGKGERNGEKIAQINCFEGDKR